jgi:hypothetical protein
MAMFDYGNANYLWNIVENRLTRMEGICPPADIYWDMERQQLLYVTQEYYGISQGCSAADSDDTLYAYNYVTGAMIGAYSNWDHYTPTNWWFSPDENYVFVTSYANVEPYFTVWDRVTGLAVRADIDAPFTEGPRLSPENHYIAVRRPQLISVYNMNNPEAQPTPREPDYEFLIDDNSTWGFIAPTVLQINEPTGAYTVELTTGVQTPLE